MNNTCHSATLWVLLIHTILNLSFASSDTFVCPAFSTSGTFSATSEYVVCSFLLCPGDYVTASVCPGSFTGDTYFRLYSAGDSQLAFNDDSCSLGSEITYHATSFLSCETIYLRQGCYSSTSCTGTTTVVIMSDISSSPSTVPPTLPPSPTTAPTAEIGVDVVFTPFSTSNTNSASSNYVSEFITICPAQEVLFTMCEFGGSYSGDTYLRLHLNGVQVAVNDDFCDSGSAISYIYSGASCELFELRQGCYSISACSGTTSVVFSADDDNNDADDDDDFSGGCSQSTIDDCFDAANGKWGQCDMCVCYLYDNFVDKDKECGNTPTLYNCFYNFDASEIKCKTEMKLGWILGFSGIGLMLVIACCACGALIYNKPKASTAANPTTSTTANPSEVNVELRIIPTAPPLYAFSEGQNDDIPGVVAVAAPSDGSGTTRWRQDDEAFAKTRI